ncbi:MAG: MarR family transcriptional regulator [Nakamurella sp.]
MGTPGTGTERAEAFDDEVEAILAASRVLVGVAAQSVAEVENRVSTPQLRALVMVSTRGPLHLNALAELMELHPSNASRAVDRLVEAGLLDRRDNPADRRHLALDHSPSGRALIDRMLKRRREAIGRILHRMPPEHRAPLVEALDHFSEAGGEPALREPWVLDWVS